MVITPVCLPHQFRTLRPGAEILSTGILPINSQTHNFSKLFQIGKQAPLCWSWLAEFRRNYPCGECVPVLALPSVPVDSPIPQRNPRRQPFGRVLNPPAQPDVRDFVFTADDAPIVLSQELLSISLSR